MKNFLSILVIATLAVASTVAAQDAPEAVVDAAAIAPVVIPEEASAPVVADALVDQTTEQTDKAMWDTKKKHHHHKKHGKKHGKVHHKHKKCCVKYVTVTQPNPECPAAEATTVAIAEPTSVAEPPVPVIPAIP
ncbi:hypothetical protein BGX26_003336 [Mortierella sp. AD094]|nr:hypothetical protein BGX26_003336 [Mortierella sp. AD094]